jgi:glucokinase
MRPNDAAQRVAIGIDIGGTKMRAGLVTEDGGVLLDERRPTRRDSFLHDIVALAVSIQLQALHASFEPLCVGVGTTGFVDLAGGRLVRSMNLGLSDVPIRDAVAAACRLPVIVDNDLHAAALAELRFGVGRSHDDFVLFNAGTGIAAGLVFGRRVLRGQTNAAGEIGHVSVLQDPSRRCGCGCGLAGCLEGLMLRARAGEPTPGICLPEVAAPPPAPEYPYVALAIVHLVNLLNPPVVALAGGMFTGNPAATDWVRGAVRASALTASLRGLLDMPLAYGGATAGLIGAAALGFEALSSHPNSPYLHAGETKR